MGKEIERRVPKGALDKIKKSLGTLSLRDLLALVAPTEPVSLAERPNAPLARVITDEQRAALARVPDVFGSVVPTERRVLEPEEVPLLMDEHLTLESVKKMAEARQTDIKAIVHNHLDVEAEDEGITKEAEVDASGRYVLKGNIIDGKSQKRFSREVRGGSPTLDPEALKKLVDDGELEHDDYLSMTSQVRVVDEAKVLLAVRKKPGLLEAIAKATTPGRNSSAIYTRNAK